MSRDVITVGSTMRIPLLYRGEYSQWRERFMNYLEEQTDGEAMINSIQNGDHPLPVIAQVSLAGTAPNAPPTLKDPQFWTAEEKKNRKIDRLARSLLIQGLPNDIYSLIDSNDTAKDLWDALERQMRGSEYGEQDRKAAILYEYETFKATEGEQLLDTYLRYLQVINDLKKCGYKKDNCELNYKFLNNLQPEWKQYDPLALVAEKTNVSKRKEKVVVQSESEGSDDEDISDLKKITALLAKAFNRKKYYAKPTNNNLRTSSASSSANKKPEYVKSEGKKEDKKADEKKRDMSKVKCYNCKKEGHFAKDCKKAKVFDGVIHTWISIINFQRTIHSELTMEELLRAPTEGYGEAIVLSEINADHFEIKINLLQLVQANLFYGRESENPHAHINSFKRITSTLRFRNVPNDVIKLMMFPYSLEGAAKTCEAWERFKELLRAFPHHGFTELTQVDTFYNGLNENEQDSLNAAVGGNLLSKTTREALNIIENKSKVRYSRNRSNASRMNATSSKTDERIDKLADQLSTLVEIVSKKVVTPAPVKAVEETCVTCGGAHSWHNCPAIDNNQASVCATTGTYNQVNPPNRV
ncbi:integrase, catalytic region, zinc finger, CCHC-type containing protein, partial [Tanacetum coccineum]